MTEALNYLTGFGGHFETEAVAGALPKGPQQPAAAGLRPLRRAIIGQRVHRAALTRTAAAGSTGCGRPPIIGHSTATRARRCSRPAGQASRWRRTACAGTRRPTFRRQCDFVDGMATMLANRDPADLEGVAMHLYRADRSHGPASVRRRRWRAADHPAEGALRARNRAGPAGRARRARSARPARV